jgi:hypothetical protein
MHSGLCAVHAPAPELINFPVPGSHSTLAQHAWIIGNACQFVAMHPVKLSASWMFVFITGPARPLSLRRLP